MKKVESVSSEETTRNRSSANLPNWQDSGRQLKRTPEQTGNEEKIGGEGLSHLQSMLPASGFGNGPRVSSSGEATKTQQKLMKAPVLKSSHIAHISEKSSLEEIRKVCRYVIVRLYSKTATLLLFPCCSYPGAY